MQNNPKKKTRSARELALGWVILLLTLPVVAFALVMSLVAIAIAIIIATNGMFEASGGSAMLFVYGVANVLMLWLIARILQRSAALLRRMRYIQEEQTRTAHLAQPERDTARLQLDEEAPEQVAQEDAQTGTARRR